MEAMSSEDSNMSDAASEEGARTEDDIELSDVEFKVRTGWYTS